MRELYWVGALFWVSCTQAPNHPSHVGSPSCASKPLLGEVCIPELEGGFFMGHEELPWTPPECAGMENCPPGVSNARDFSPPHVVQLKSFFLDQYPVTNQQYLACVSAGACPDECQSSASCAGGKFDEYHIRDPKLADYPVSTVSYAGAKAYCFFVGKRLPTEAEWERAARGPSGTNHYPWGNEPLRCGPGSFPCEGEEPPFGWSKTWHFPLSADDVTPEGIHGMGMGVPELVQDLYHPNFYVSSPVHSPVSSFGVAHVVRGNIPTHGQLTYHGTQFPLPVWARGESNLGGFRCARTDNANATADESFLEQRKKLLSGQSISGDKP